MLVGVGVVLDVGAIAVFCLCCWCLLFADFRLLVLLLIVLFGMV